jgi:arylsulfatase
VIPAEAELAPWAEGIIPHWHELSESEQRAACALMEVYAGFAEHTDAQVGRLVEALAELGALEDTLIFYILGDNGAAAEAGIEGSSNSMLAESGLRPTPEEIVAARDSLGEPASWPSYPVGWALAMDAPLQWTKRFASHYGGTRNGLIVHWPAHIDAGGEVRPQWHHVIDVAPTVLEAAGIPHPLLVDGTPQLPIEGTAMNYTFADAGAPDRHTTQYFEVEGTRAIYHEGWIACAPHRLRPWDFTGPTSPLADDVWELYDATDWSQARNVAHLHPEKLEALKDLFLIEAARHNVLPMEGRSLMNRSGLALADVLPRTAVFRQGMRDLPVTAVPSTTSSSHAISARVTVPEAGAAGVICAQGGRFGGWVLYCHEGRLTYCNNVGTGEPFYLRTEGRLDPGAHELRFELDYETANGGGTARLLVDGVKLAEGRAERTVRSVFEGFDVGADRLSTVSPETRVGDNAFTGEIAWVRIDAGENVEGAAAKAVESAAATQ